MKKCKDCLFKCTKGSSISLCDVCYDGDEFIEGTTEEYLEIATKYRKMKKQMEELVIFYTVDMENPSKLCKKCKFFISFLNTGQMIIPKCKMGQKRGVIMCPWFSPMK